MEDIGMSPDYRSGWNDDRCAICNRRVHHWADTETCPECGREVCRLCYNPRTSICDDCEDRAAT